MNSYCDKPDLHATLKEITETRSHFDSIWFDMGRHIIHLGLDDSHNTEKRGPLAFDGKNLQGLMDRLNDCEIPYEKDLNMPRAKWFYTYAFFGHRMDFLGWDGMTSPSH